MESMKTVGDRIQWILENCQISQRELARRAGFTASSQLNAIVRRLASRPDSIELKTAKAIARGAGVSERWLLTGDGKPSDGDAIHQGNLTMMIYRCRTTKPKVSEWFDIEAESPELAANAFHSDHNDELESLAFYPDPDMMGKSVRFVCIEVEGHEIMVSRLFVSEIARRGGALRKTLPTLEEIAKRLDYQHDPGTLLEEGWEGEEPETRTG